MPYGYVMLVFCYGDANLGEQKEATMTDELGREELLERLDKCWSLYNTSQDEWESSQQAYQQIKQILLGHFNDKNK